jgi:hypothetical protein
VFDKLHCGLTVVVFFAPMPRRVQLRLKMSVINGVCSMTRLDDQRAGLAIGSAQAMLSALQAALQPDAPAMTPIRDPRLALSALALVAARIIDESCIALGPQSIPGALGQLNFEATQAVLSALDVRRAEAATRQKVVAPTIFAGKPRGLVLPKGVRAPSQ